MNLYLQIGSNNYHEIKHNDILNSEPIIGSPSDNVGYEKDVADVKAAISQVPFTKHNPMSKIPPPGKPVPFYAWRRAGCYLLGQRRAVCPVKCMYLCCARREQTYKYYTIKILALKDYENNNETLTQDDIQGMLLMQNEYFLLNELKGKTGVYQVHDYFKDWYMEEVQNEDSVLVYTGKVKVRLCLVLDYVALNDTYPECELVNLQQYVLNNKPLSERQAITIFREIVSVVQMLHENNIIHRDLKLGNMMLHKKTLKVTLINFGLGIYLPNEDVMISDQRGSPAYISPDVLSGNPFAPKPNDMWALGVTLYVMLMENFPFYDTNSFQLFHKIMKGSYIIPLSRIESLNTVELIKGLLVYNSELRFKIDDAINLISLIIKDLKISINEPMQIVPNLESERKLKPGLPDEYRWKFAVVQRGNRTNLRPKIGAQVPILHVSSDERRVKAIEMKCIQSTRAIIRPMPINYVRKIPISSGMFAGKPVLSQLEPPNKIDQIVPELNSDTSNSTSSTSSAPIGVLIIPATNSSSQPECII